MNDKIRFSPKDALKQLFVNPIPAFRVPHNREWVGRFKRLDACDVLAYLPNRSGIRRKGRKEKTEEKN
jgi:hypothetical protein